MWISDLNKLSETVGKKLVASGQTIAVAESLTAGHLQAAIARVSGASRYFRGGVTAYSLETKVKILGVERQKALRTNCVSAEVAREMAMGVRELFGCDIGVATTGYAESTQGPEGKCTPPFAFYAIVSKDLNLTGEIDAPPTMERPDVQEYIANYVLSRLEANLKGANDP